MFSILAVVFWSIMFALHFIFCVCACVCVSIYFIWALVELEASSSLCHKNTQPEIQYVLHILSMSRCVSICVCVCVCVCVEHVDVTSTCSWEPTTMWHDRPIHLTAPVTLLADNTVCGHCIHCLFWGKNNKIKTFEITLSRCLNPYFWWHKCIFNRLCTVIL